jgi:hypothetical protein
MPAARIHFKQVPLTVVEKIKIYLEIVDRDDGMIMTILGSGLERSFRVGAV